jgi:hypothetical protein
VSDRHPGLADTDPAPFLLQQNVKINYTFFHSKFKFSIQSIENYDAGEKDRH